MIVYLSGELLTTKPFHGTKLRWRDVVLRDVQRMGLDARSWYEVAQDRSRWHDLCKPFCQKELLRVPLWSLALLSVVVGELLIALEI